MRKMNDIFNYIKLYKTNIIILSAVIIIITLYTGLSYKLTKETIEKSIDEIGYKDAIIASQKVGEWIEKKTNIIKKFADKSLVKSMDWDEIEPYIKNVVNTLDEFDEIIISDIEGNYITTNDNIKLNLIEDRFLKEVSYGSPKFSKPVKILDDKLYHIVTAPIFNEDEIVGYISALVKNSLLNDFIRIFKVNSKGSYSYIVNKNGETISHIEGKNINNENIMVPSEVIPKELAMVSRRIVSTSNGRVNYTYKDIEAYAYYSIIPNTDNWKIVSKVPEQFISRPIFNYSLFIFLGGILIIVVISLTLYYFSKISYNNKLKYIIDIEKQNAELEKNMETEHLKTEFFSNLSHEFKTPLNIIFSSIQMLNVYLKRYNNDKELNIDSLTSYVDLIKQNGYRLLRLTNNLIDITRIDSGFMSLNLQNKNIVTVVEDIVLSTVQYVKNKNRKIIFDTNTEELIMAFDSDMMERIILNLISNAVKFTSEGDIIEVSLFDCKNFVELSIKDSGKGIDKENQYEIFNRFKQVETLLNRKSEGSGIGLSLVKSMIEMHGGNVEVKSEKNVGTEFILTIPIRLIYNSEVELEEDKLSKQSKIEKISIEFSDIYH